MAFSFSRMFHIVSKLHTGYERPIIPADRSLWPEAWSQTVYKKYDRVRTIPLYKGSNATAPLSQLLHGRVSNRAFANKSLPLATLSELLYLACGETTHFSDDRARRAYPSAGALYPIEVYVLVRHASQELALGVYHYDVRDHSLKQVQKNITSPDVRTYFTYDWVGDVPVVILLTSIFFREQRKYGERGYRYALLEAGHIGQNIYLVAQALGLGCCALGGTNDEKLEEQLLGVDGITESLVYGLAVGSVDSASR